MTTWAVILRVAHLSFIGLPVTALELLVTRSLRSIRVRPRVRPFVLIRRKNVINTGIPTASVVVIVPSFLRLMQWLELILRVQTVGASLGARTVNRLSRVPRWASLSAGCSLVTAAVFWPFCLGV